MQNMENNVKINIGGIPVLLEHLYIPTGKGITVYDNVMYSFFSGNFKNFGFIAAIPNNPKHESPKSLSKRRVLLEKAFNKTVVFLFDHLKYYERERLIQRNVYYIVSGKYAFLPFLLMNSLETDSPYRSTSSLLPPSQFLLFWHLQKSSLNGKNMNDIASITKMSQSSVSRALTQLETCGIVEIQKHADRTKTVTFKSEGKALWELASPHLDSPMWQIWYCDRLDVEKWPQGGISALSHFTMLSPDPEQTVVMSKEQFKTEKDNIAGLNRLDGDIIIQVWKYAPLADGGYVDKLSLYLTLKDNSDPRVDKENEMMLSKLWYTA